MYHVLLTEKHMMRTVESDRFKSCHKSAHREQGRVISRLNKAPFTPNLGQNRRHRGQLTHENQRQRLRKRQNVAHLQQRHFHGTQDDVQTEEGNSPRKMTDRAIHIHNLKDVQ